MSMNNKKELYYGSLSEALPSTQQEVANMLFDNLIEYCNFKHPTTGKILKKKFEYVDLQILLDAVLDQADNYIGVLETLPIPKQMLINTLKQKIKAPLK